MTEQNFNPETCTIDELKAKIEELKNKEEYYNTMQLSAKTFINSVYGVFGTAWFNLSNTDIAESITLQGQDLIKFSVTEINDYINNHWNQDYDGHKRIADRMRSIFGDAFKYDQFLECAKNNTIKLDTVQVYGDSVIGNSMISLSNNSYKSISRLFNEGKNLEMDDLGKERVSSEESVYCLNTVTGCLDVKRIKYVMRHKLNKRLYKVSNENYEIICTEDHSIMKLDNKSNKIIEVRPTDISIDDCLIVRSDTGCIYVSGFECEQINDKRIKYVYDIEVDSETNEYHNFFANGLLVHNTDSVSKDTIIRTKKHSDGITIEDFYNENEFDDFIEVEDENGNVYKFKLYEYIKIRRNDKVIEIQAKDIQNTDEICI